MSQTQVTRAGRRERPVSPHLTVYRWPPTMLMSILHRITGGALYFGTLLVAWWLLATATSEQQFDIANAVFGSWLGGWCFSAIPGCSSTTCRRHPSPDLGHGVVARKAHGDEARLANLAISIAATILVLDRRLHGKGA